MGNIKNAESCLKIRMFIKFTYACITIKENIMDIKQISILVET